MGWAAWAEGSTPLNLGLWSHGAARKAALCGDSVSADLP